MEGARGKRRRSRSRTGSNEPRPKGQMMRENLTQTKSHNSKTKMSIHMTHLKELQQEAYDPSTKYLAQEKQC